ncbi:hypothetical protein LCGC14_2304830 [marine sediment metagenome]|uniref:ASCH domain-containing protein n=1 Tax=marine sediment metagenome TaxID=412755 RepID=A0A0F9EZT5_9ZZZZ
METIKERPILFKTESIQAILDDRKSQTRRVVKPQPDYSILKEGVTLEAHKCPVLGPVHLGRREWGLYGTPYKATDVPCFAYNCPYGKIGDRLWCKETFCIGEIVEVDTSDGYPEDCYVSQCPEENSIIPKEYCLRHDIGIEDVIWKPSIHMFRKDSRIDLEITDIRVERVQDISWEDLLAEGYPQPKKGITKESIIYPTMTKMLEWFIPLWDSINSKRGYGWNVNPRTWVIVFKVLSKELL